MKLWRPRASAPEAKTRSTTVTGPDRKKQVEEALPLPVEIAGQWAWRILIIVAVVAVIGYLIISLRVIVVPFVIAMLIAALLVPFKGFLIRHHWPRWLAIVLALILAAAIIVALLYIVVIQVRHGFPNLQKQTLAAYDRFQDFLAAPPFNIDKAAYTKDVDNIVASI